MNRSIKDTRAEDLAVLRAKHGFRTPVNGAERVGKWSKETLREGSVTDDKGEVHALPAQSKTWPKNQPLLDAIKAKFAVFGFDWETYEFPQRVRNNEWVTRKGVRYKNLPTVAGRHLSLVELYLIPVEMIDGYDRHVLNAGFTIGAPVRNHTLRMARMNKTGTGYKGIAGVSWLPSVEPLRLPADLEETLRRIGEAVFLLYDAARELYGTDPELTALLRHHAPDRIPELVTGGTVDVLRPDMVLLGEGSGYRPVITELESCPGGHGIGHALDVGYGLPTAMLDTYVEYLAGRPYIVAATHQWSEYVFDQAAFCRALRERGVDARIVFDRPLEVVHEEAPKNWKPPKDIPASVAAAWNTDFLGRLRLLGALEYVHGVHDFPDDVGEAVVYRFGYFDNFSRIAIDRMHTWQRLGASVVNPLQFYLESKVLMAAGKLAPVRRWIQKRNEAALGVLDKHLAETRLLAPGFADMDELTKDKDFWLTKYAAWDGENKSWGSRSLVVGSEISNDAWAQSLAERMKRPHPVVAQHVIASATFDIAHADEQGNLALLEGARARLTPFLIRGKGGTVLHAGSSVTFRVKTFRIHGATDAVDAPVVFG